MYKPWQTVTTIPPLPQGELHVWRISLPDAQTDPGSYTRTLTPEEVARAARLRVGHVRLQFVIARAVLRVLLGNYLSLDPDKVVVETGPQGKPAVPGHIIRFNVAHSGGAVLVALSRSCEVGIDLEQVDRELEALDIARNSFSVREIAELQSIADTHQLQQAFFHCWTRKEAIIKADGRGLSLPLVSFDVPVVGEVSATPVKVYRPGIPESTTFFLSDLPCGEGVAAAFAVDSPQIRLQQFDFSIGLLLSAGGSNGPPG